MKYLSLLLILLILAPTLLPVSVSAQQNANSSGIWKDLIVCDGTTAKPCNFSSLIEFVQNLINDLIVISIPIVAIAFAWAGFLILTSGGDPGKLKTGKGIMIKVGIGFAWIIGAYVVVSFIIKTFVDPKGVTQLLNL